MKTNGEAIYGTTASPFRIPPGAASRPSLATMPPRCTYTSSIGRGRQAPRCLNDTVRDCHLLADPTRKFAVDNQPDAGLTSTLPATPPTPSRQS